MTDQQTESMWLGNVEFKARSSGGRGRSARKRKLRARNASAAEGSVGREPDVINGKLVDPAAQAAAPSVVDRSHVPPAVMASMRNQVADFADFAHRSRIAPDSADALQALGCGGGVTAVAVEHMAAELFGKEVVALLGADQQTLTDSLLLSLVAPEDPEKLTERQRELFVSWRGRLALDVSMAEIGEEPVTTVIRPGDHPERQLPAGGAEASTASAVDLTAPCAALIVGSAAFIAGDRPYLSLDTLMTYARNKVYRSSGPAGAPATQAAGLRAARNLEVVLLLDRSLCGGLWVDIDRANGRAAAALAVRLSPKDGARFTHIPKLRVPNLRTLAEGVATA